MSDAIRVSFDATSVPAKPAGAGRYVLDLLDALSVRPELDITVWTRRSDGERFAAILAGGRSAPDREHALRPAAPRARPLRLGWEQVLLPGLVARSGAEVHHGPHYTMPELSRLAKVVTVHDLTFFDHPEWHERWKVGFFRRAIRVASERAQAIICVSSHTADLLRERFRPAGPVFVVPHGVDHHRFHPGACAGDDTVGERYGIGGPYLLFVGTIEPRKAVPVLIGAFDLLAGARPELVLVLAGAPGWGSEEVDAAIRAARHAERVIRLGYVPRDDVPALLRGASAVVYPAMEEGFGLPALEALACGTQLVTTRATAMAELAGGAAWLAEAGSATSLAEAIEGALAGGSEASAKRELGLDTAASYTWEASAAGHISAYRAALAAAGDRPSARGGSVG